MIGEGLAERSPGPGRRLSIRGSLLLFVAMTGAVLASAMALLVLLDPRTRAFWAARWAELLAFVSAFLPR